MTGSNTPFPQLEQQIFIMILLRLLPAVVGRIVVGRGRLLTGGIVLPYGSPFYAFIVSGNCLLSPCVPMWPLTNKRLTATLPARVANHKFYKSPTPTLHPLHALLASHPWHQPSAYCKVSLISSSRSSETLSVSFTLSSADCNFRSSSTLHLGWLTDCVTCAKPL